MVSEVLKPNVQALQGDVIDLLQEISLLMNRASTELSSDGSSQKYLEFEQQVNQEIEKVKNLELRMAIVAPMKAGKSTITNAIIGQDILPSRNAAMTTLPTEIIFDAGIQEPILTLSPEIVTVFQETLLALRKQINEMGIEAAQAKLAQYPHLQNMPKLIQKALVNSIPHQSKGRKDIILTLTSLNDIVRLCSILYPSVAPLQSLTEVPRIRTPFRLSQGNQQSETLGKLVIVDTPGPNEAGENLRLQTVVAEQLRKTSMVLIVLDFTQLKNEAAEKVKKDVRRVIELRGKESLYVLINKVDQRRDGDMTPEQVQKFVAAEFGIGDAGESNRVFEISARRAFTSANFLMELQQYPNVTVNELKTSHSLAQEVYGIDWEDELAEATLEDLNKKADRLWKKSGFDPFLNGAINALMIEAAPRCMMSALKITRSRLMEVNKNVQLRNSAVNQDGEKIQKEVDSLSNDLSKLEWCLIDLEEQVDETKKSLSEKLDSTLKKLKTDTDKSIQDYFLDGIAERLNQVDKSNDIISISTIEKMDIAARKFLLTPIRLTDNIGSIFPESISRFIKYEVGLRGRNEFEFKTQREAEEFAGQLVAEAKQIVEAFLYKTIKQIENEITNSQEYILVLLKHKTKGVIENAHNRLNQSFLIELELPPLLLQDMEAQFGDISDYTLEEEEPFNIVKTVVNFFKKIFNKSYANQKENKYIVSLENTVFQFNKAVELKIQDTQHQINQYLDHAFQVRVSKFFKELEGYLQNYKNSLSQALQDQELSLAEQEEVKEKLIIFVNETNYLLNSIEKQQKFIKQLLP